jgi:hypothetical protein
METAIQLLNRILIAALFLSLAGFGWFVIAVSGAFMGIPLGYKLWTQLWVPLFQPALGLLMAGAIASGIGSWMRRQRSSGD